MATLSSLCIYPLKSCAPLPVACAEVQPRGLQHDRRWLLVDADGRFITGRQESQLTLVQATPTATGIRFAAAGHEAIDVPLPATGAARLDVTIWGSQVSAACAGEFADRWFSRVLQHPLRLVHMDALAHRAIDDARAQPGDEVGFADGYPLLLISAAALDALNARLPAPVTMDRFRPNLVVDGVAAHAEDGWRRIRIGGVEFDVVKACIRCVFTTVDPANGRRDPDGEPLRTLLGYRRGSKGVSFGQHLIPRGHGVLRIGDPVCVLDPERA
jgi:uncharacterized protein